MEAPVLNAANGLTVARILCTPPLVLLLLMTPDGHLAAAAAFGFLALTDALDGYLARSRQLITTLGTMLDPIADKLLIGGALVALVATDRLHFAIAGIILAREVLVTALRQVAYRKGTIHAAGLLGKLKMASQVTMVLVLVAIGPSDSIWLRLLIGAAVVMTIASALSYLSALPAWRSQMAARRQPPPGKRLVTDP